MGTGRGHSVLMVTLGNPSTQHGAHADRREFSLDHNLRSLDPPLSVAVRETKPLHSHLFLNLIMRLSH